MALNNLLTRNPEKWFALESAVEAGWSYNMIQRELKIDYRTVKTWYPNYKPFPVGGGGEAAVIRQVNQDLERIDKYGHISTRQHRE